MDSQQTGGGPWGRDLGQRVGEPRRIRAAINRPMMEAGKAEPFPR